MFDLTPDGRVREQAISIALHFLHSSAVISLDLLLPQQPVPNQHHESNIYKMKFLSLLVAVVAAVAVQGAEDPKECEGV